MSNLVTVVMTCYNNEKFVESALLSAIHQTLEHNLIVINDGSTDNSQEIIEKVLNKHKVPRVTLINNPTNAGQAQRYNEAVTLAKTKYIAYLDSDDMSRDYRLKTQLDFLESNPNIWCVGTHCFTVDENQFWYKPGDKVTVSGQYVYPPEKHTNIVQHLMEQHYSPMLHPTVMYRREGFLGYDLSKPHPNLCDDLDLWCRSIKKGLKFHNIQEQLIAYRIHPNSLSQRFPELIVQEADRIINHYFPLR